jgi:hypothetical protein
MTTVRTHVRKGRLIREHQRKRPRYRTHYGVYVEYLPRQRPVSSALPTIEDAKKFMKNMNVSDFIKSVKVYPVVAKDDYAQDYKKKGKALLIKTQDQKIRKVNK